MSSQPHSSAHHHSSSSHSTATVLPTHPTHQHQRAPKAAAVQRACVACLCRVARISTWLQPLPLLVSTRVGSRAERDDCTRASSVPARCYALVVKEGRCTYGGSSCLRSLQTNGELTPQTRGFGRRPTTKNQNFEQKLRNMQVIVLQYTPHNADDQTSGKNLRMRRRRRRRRSKDQSARLHLAKTTTPAVRCLQRCSA